MMKAAAFSRAVTLRKSEVRQVLLHTGQHYSHDMSGQFQQELQLPDVDVQLRVDSDPAMRMGQMMKGVADAIATHQPDAVVVFGDTDSTLAAALASSRAHVPVVHIEAGLRSFDRRMPEELNRILTDQLSDVLFCPSEDAKEQLRSEGISNGARPGLHVEAVGDLMLDTARFHGGIPEKIQSDRPQSVLLTLHRPSNVDDALRLQDWLDGIGALAQKEGLSILFPVHPRTKKTLLALWGDCWKDELQARKVVVYEPASYLQMLKWLKEVDEVWTDSGGLQKEAFFMHRPALVLRSSTEWTELLDGGFAKLCPRPEELIQARSALNQSRSALDFQTPIYGGGDAGSAMVNSIIQWLNR